MDTKQLKQLLQQPESPTLEFKQELKIYSKGDGARRERDELKRDLLSLANGNARVAGETKHLVIGRVDQPMADGRYELLDVGDKHPSADDLLKMLAQCCYPPLDTIYSDLMHVDGKRLLVITVPATPYLHETTKELNTPKRTYTEHTVFMRRDESIAIASARERSEMRRAKQRYFDERDNVPPRAFGAAVGAILLAPVSRQQAKKSLGYGPVGQVIAGALGSLVGAFMGGMLGNIYKDIRDMKRWWPELTTGQKAATFSVFTSIAALISSIWSLVKKRLRQQQNIE